MRQYHPNLEPFEISASRYRELEFFCYQYGEKQEALSDILHGTHTPLDGMPKGCNVSNPTERAAIVAAILSKDCEDIEQAVIGATSEKGASALYQYLLNYVTRRKKPPINSIPCGRRQFYEMRKRFFVILHEKRCNPRI